MKAYLIAGEASGDLLGGRLMAALRAQHPDIEFHGIGGEKMSAQGLGSFFSMSELTAMGIAEILPRIPHFLKRIRQVVQHIDNIKPDILITIDAPDFCFRVVKELRKKNVKFPCVHYVAPTVWAWRPKRAEHIAKLYDHLLCLFPFEPPYFEMHGLKTTFVGHPIIGSAAGKGNATRFRRQYRLGDNETIFCLLPGSRSGEIKRLLPVFVETVQLLKKDFSFHVAIPVLSHTEKLVQDILGDQKDDFFLLQTEQEKFDCFAASKVALAASGSVALELAEAKLPAVIAYRMNALTSLVVPYMMKIKFANLVNILLNREVVPEFLLQNCQPENLAAALALLLSNDEARVKQVESYQQATKMLWPSDGKNPDDKAAEAVLKLL